MAELSVQAWRELRMSGKWVGRWRVWPFTGGCDHSMEGVAIQYMLVTETSSVYYRHDYLGLQLKCKDVQESTDRTVNEAVTNMLHLEQTRLPAAYVTKSAHGLLHLIASRTVRSDWTNSRQEKDI